MVYQLLGSYLSPGTLECKREIAATYSCTVQLYRGADKSLAQLGRKQATATEDFEIHISYL